LTTIAVFLRLNQAWATVIGGGLMRIGKNLCAIKLKPALQAKPGFPEPGLFVSLCSFPPPLED